MSLPASTEQEIPRLTRAVQVLIAISVVMLYLQKAVGNFAGMTALLGFDTAALPVRWWSPLTYMFVHAGFWHFAANMYALWLFGPRVEQAWGAKRFAWFYVLCGLAGVACYIVFVHTGTLVGASAAVFGVMTAYTMQWPNDEIYLLGVLPMRVRTLFVALVAINLTAGWLGTTDAVGAVNIAYFAHLGGIAAAYVYVRMLATGGMEQVRQRVANLPEADEPPRAIPRSLPRSRDRGDEVDDIVAKSKAIVAKRPASLTPTSRRREPKADELNRVLDKISEHGIESLTMDERKVLEEMSRRLRNDR